MYPRCYLTAAPFPRAAETAHPGRCQQHHDRGRGFYLRGFAQWVRDVRISLREGNNSGFPISWVDRSGKTELLHAPPDVYYAPRFSPDGKRLAFSMANGQGDDIWMKDLDRDPPSRLTFLPARNLWPVWTPDGKNIVFLSFNSAAPGMYWIRSGGSGEAQRLTDGTPDSRVRRCWRYSGWRVQASCELSLGRR